MNLRNQIIRLAYERPEFRDDLLSALLGGKTAYDMCRKTPELCVGNLGIPRSKMPQVKDSFIQYLKGKGHKVTGRKLLPSALRATQKDISGKMAEGIMRDFRAGKFDPTKGVIASKEGFILNGHHRWAALLMNNRQFGESVKISVVQVDLPIRDLLDEAHGFGGTEYRTVDESMARHGSDPLSKVEAYTHTIHSLATQLVRDGAPSLRRVDVALDSGDTRFLRKEVGDYLKEVQSKVDSMQAHVDLVRKAMKEIRWIG